MITATESIALRWRVIGAHGAVVRYALDCNWCARPLFVRDYYGFRAGESETCTCGALNYVHLNEHGEPVACMEDEGESRREAGERLGLASDSGRKRIQRAVARLKAHLAKSAVPFRAPVPLSTPTGPRSPGGRTAMTDEPIPILSLPGDEDFIRLPGLFRRWELNDVVEVGADFHLEDAGEAADGTQLIAVYRRERRSPQSTTTDSSTNPNKKEQ